MVAKTEKEVKASFLKYKRAFVKKLGKTALYNDTIDEICSKLLKDQQWNGVHPHDEMLFKPGYQIVNTAKSTSKEGLHWVAIYQTPKTIYVYDSYGRPTGSILKDLKKKAKKNNLRVVESDRDAEQIGYSSETCGHMSVSWLLCVKQYGIRNALKI